MLTTHLTSYIKRETIENILKKYIETETGKKVKALYSEILEYSDGVYGQSTDYCSVFEGMKIIFEEEVITSIDLNL